jgi:hypothetical protein
MIQQSPNLAVWAGIERLIPALAPCFLLGVEGVEMKKTIPIDVDRCNELFEYRDGQLIRKLATRAFVKVGDSVGTTSAGGYLTVRVDGKIFKVSRIIYAMHYGDPGQKQVDHINHIRTDNRIENLRIVTVQENAHNQSKLKRNTSGFTGVNWNKKAERWVVHINVDKKQAYLGSFKKKRDAIFRRKLAEIAYGYHSNHGS